MLHLTLIVVPNLTDTHSLTALVCYTSTRSSVQCAGKPLRLSSSDDGGRSLCLSGNDPGLLLHQHHPHLPHCWSHHRSDRLLQVSHLPESYSNIWPLLNTMNTPTRLHLPYTHIKLTLGEILECILINGPHSIKASLYTFVEFVLEYFSLTKV